jgi:hypothetical protein
MTPYSVDDRWDLLVAEHHARGRRVPWIDLAVYCVMVRWLRRRIRMAAR